MAGRKPCPPAAPTHCAAPQPGGSQSRDPASPGLEWFQLPIPGGPTSWGSDPSLSEPELRSSVLV